MGESEREKAFVTVGGRGEPGQSKYEDCDAIVCTR